MFKLAELFLTFAKIGCFTFGGGYAMIALIRDSCVDEKKWITNDEMMDISVVAESTPGPVSINCATYIGYRQAGMPGAVIATLGTALPSFVIIYIISRYLDAFLEIGWIASAFQGIRIVIGILIFDAGLSMLKHMEKSWLPMAITACSCAVMLAVNLLSLSFSSIVLMLIAASVSLAAAVAKNAAMQRKAEK